MRRGLLDKTISSLPKPKGMICQRHFSKALKHGQNRKLKERKHAIRTVKLHTCFQVSEAPIARRSAWGAASVSYKLPRPYSDKIAPGQLLEGPQLINYNFYLHLTSNLKQPYDRASDSKRLSPSAQRAKPFLSGTPESSKSPL